MAKEGFGNALVPLGLARAMHVPLPFMHELNPMVKREIRLHCRKNLSLLPVVKELTDVLRSVARKIF